jgi:hypothetical protein
MRHRTTPRFWEHYRNLPKEVRDLANKNFRLLQSNPGHPSLQFKKIGNVWSARSGWLIGPWLSRTVRISCGCGLVPTTTMIDCSGGANHTPQRTGGQRWFWARWPGQR